MAVIFTTKEPFGNSLFSKLSANTGAGENYNDATVMKKIKRNMSSGTWSQHTIRAFARQ
jgi:hypothetical protein